MPERERAYRGEEIVTVLEGRIGSKRLVTIRNSRGFVEKVRGKELGRIPANDPKSKLRYAADE